MSLLLPHNEWDELQAAEEGEWLLAQADAGNPGPCTGEDLRRVERDAMKAMAVGIPNAEAYARWFETAHHEAAFALCEAFPVGGQGCVACLRVHDGPQVPLLRSLGLVEVRGFGLGCFGNAVRKIMTGEVEG